MNFDVKYKLHLTVSNLSILFIVFRFLLTQLSLTLYTKS